MWVMRGNSQEWLQGFWPEQLVNVGTIYDNGTHWEKTIWVEGGRIMSPILSVLGLNCQVGSEIYQSGAQGTGL